MIKVGIAGADLPVAGELLRLCLHHPDVDIVTAYAPGRTGQPISAVHHGFIGEEKIVFTSNFDATALDIAFLFSSLYSESDWVKLMADRPGLKVVLSDAASGAGMAMSTTPVYGLSEINRKPLVRGARVAVLPHPLASPLLVAMYPLARHLMLNGNISADIEAPEDIVTSSDQSLAKKEIIREIQRVQTSFSGNVDFKITPLPATSRTIKVAFEIPSSIAIDEIFKIYDSIYDDHNFTFMLNRSVDTVEVEGTHKIIISILKPSSDILRIEAVADCRMRGGAGEALHLMNLLFNLHEKTGLDLKVSVWK